MLRSTCAPSVNFFYADINLVCVAASDGRSTYRHVVLRRLPATKKRPFSFQVSTCRWVCIFCYQVDGCVLQKRSFLYFFSTCAHLARLLLEMLGILKRDRFVSYCTCRQHSFNNALHYPICWQPSSTARASQDSSASRSAKSFNHWTYYLLSTHTSTKGCILRWCLFLPVSNNFISLATAGCIKFIFLGSSRQLLQGSAHASTKGCIFC